MSRKSGDDQAKEPSAMSDSACYGLRCKVKDTMTDLGSGDVGDLSFTTRLTLWSGVHDKDGHLRSHGGQRRREGRGRVAVVRKRGGLFGKDGRGSDE